MHSLLILLTLSSSPNNQAAYLTGAVTAFIILCYLLYYLIKPDKF